jgi:hypothetical protein
MVLQVNLLATVADKNLHLTLVEQVLPGLPLTLAVVVEEQVLLATAVMVLVPQVAQVALAVAVEVEEVLVVLITLMLLVALEAQVALRFTTNTNKGAK